MRQSKETVVNDDQTPQNPQPSSPPDLAILSVGTPVPDVADDGQTEGIGADFQWQASEYVHHHKNSLWYFGVVGVVIILSGLAYILKSWFSIALFIVMGTAVIVYAKRPPRVLTYELSNDGLTIDGKLFPFKTFRSFSVVPDVTWHSIDLEPTQRFMPRMSVLFDETDFDAIVNHLLERLPRIDRNPDFVERITRFLRF
jgi:hypothetical protein